MEIGAEDEVVDRVVAVHMKGSDSALIVTQGQHAVSELIGSGHCVEWACDAVETDTV